MKPLICPQCGGKVTEYAAWQNSAECGYCATKFIITPEREEKVEEFYQPPPVSGANNILVLSIMGGVLLVGGLILFGVILSNSKKTASSKTYPATTSSPGVAQRSPSPTPKLNLLEFGGKGKTDGLFDEAVEIALDADGSIYVADESLRVQRFDAQGKFSKVWQVPSSTVNYKRARTIQKIAVDAQKRLYVLVGGVILTYEPNATEHARAIHFAPEAIQDFALRADGTLLAIVNYGDVEVLAHLNRAGKVIRRVEGFHSLAADAAISPYETGIASIRLAVDGAGNIFSVFALADLGSYQVSMDPEDFLIFRFTPEGKYVNKFYQTSNSDGIAVDGQDRLYISEREAVAIISAKDGTRLGSFPDFGSIRSFALDKQNNIYVVTSDSRIIKRAPPF